MNIKSQEGHRKRLREKFIRSGVSGFHDYEIVELLLTLGTPRKNCKQQAKESIKKFKSLKGVLEAPMERLQEIDGIGPHNAFGIKLSSERLRKAKRGQIALTERQMKIVEHINLNGKITNKDIRNMFKISPQAAYKEIKKLLKLEVVKPVGKGRGLYYALR